MVTEPTALTKPRAEIVLPDLPWTLTRVDASIRPDATFADFQRMYDMAMGMVHSGLWWIGALLVAAEERFGEEAAQLVDPLDYADSTIAHARYVAERIEPCRRRQSLSWSHHAEVAPLPPDIQDEWLSLAEENNWTRAELRKEMKAAQAPDVSMLESARQKLAQGVEALTEAQASLRGTGKEKLARLADDKLQRAIEAAQDCWEMAR